MEFWWQIKWWIIPLRERRVACFSKLISKRYDKVSWSFLRFMLKKLSFGESWMKWMEAMVFSSNMSVMVTGSPTNEFKVERGLRQGDPISPFLFVIVAEGLKGLVNKAVDNGDYSGFSFNGNYFIDVI